MSFVGCSCQLLELDIPTAKALVVQTWVLRASNSSADSDWIGGESQPAGLNQGWSEDGQTAGLEEAVVAFVSEACCVDQTVAPTETRPGSDMASWRPRKYSSALEAVHGKMYWTWNAASLAEVRNLDAAEDRFVCEHE